MPSPAVTFVSIAIDPISFVLVVSMMLSAGVALALATGRAQRLQQRQRASLPSVDISSPASILARADAAARQRSVGYRPDGSRPNGSRPAGLHLQGVRAVEATGHVIGEADLPKPDRTERRAELTALAFHIAENDPQRMAEVITEWIRTNESANHNGLH